MKRFTIFLMCIFAFLVFLKGGEKVPVLDAIGFEITDKVYAENTITVMSFFDKDGRIVNIFPLDIIWGAVYLPEGKVL